MKERKYILHKAHIDDVATLECSLCKCKLVLVWVKQNYEDNYPWRIYKEALICGGCAHDLFDEHEKPAEGVDSIICRCGLTIANDSK